LKQLLAAANPGLATKDDLAQLEERVDELSELVSELEQKIGAGGGEKG
jgi:polyhydroxyalkanoate synthesis regulator phasin